MEFSDTLDGRGGDSAKAAEIFLSNTYKPTKGKMDVDLRKLPLNPYNTTLCDFAKDFIKS